MFRSRLSYLDALDRRILQCVERDARLSNKQLAKAVGISESACSHRLRRLERNGVIKQYVADIDALELGGVVLYGEITLTAHGRASRVMFEKALHDERAIPYAAQIAGRADYMLLVSGHEVDIWSSLLQRLDPEGVLIASSSVQTQVRVSKRFSGWPQLLAPT
ncbi:Lrp/AsnC family transcriptional regulator [Vitreimonas flagellata]|uniref:Lrp/AsnC family transcriptional regulator n=1 Tax=Vitreimonas flagellata TaxID=2560861 RepID=UPI0010754A21|nr:Lrp/AsnC family transcriptional regulator [Vitreimonas flagellata]